MFLPMLAEAGEEFFEVSLAGEGGRLRYVVWLDNLVWRVQVERFIELYAGADYVEPFIR